MRLIFAGVVASFLIASSASAATYYVATTGSDTAAGTIAAPFRTIKAASRIARAGDVVNVRGGIYYDAASLYQVKGTAAAPIVFRAMAGETAIVDGSNLAAGTSILGLNDSAFVEVSGFEVRNTHIGITVWHSNNVRVLNNHVHHTVRNGIYVGGDVLGANSDITVSGNNVHDTVLENQYHTMTTGGWAGAVVVSRTERATITGNRIYNNDGEGLISVRSNNAVIRNNEISDNFSAYVYLDNARFATIDRNLIYSTGNTRYFRDGRPGSGIGIANETTSVMNLSSDNVITNNVVIGTRWGFYYGNYETGGGLKNTKVLNNTFYGTTDEIIRVEDDAHANSVVANNIFFQTGSVAPRYAGTNGVSYNNNLWYGSTAGVAAGVADVIGNPLFANAGGRTAADYRLTALSPAIGKGATRAEVASDHFGTTRTVAMDIGAHEQSSGAADAVAPSTPSNLRATGGDATSVTLAWDAAADNVGVSGYSIVRNGVTVTTINALTWTDRSVTSNTTYAYQVQSTDAAGNRSVLSSVLTLAWSAAEGTAPATPAPVPPTGLTVTAAGNSVRVTWAAAGANAAEYSVYRNGTFVGAAKSALFVDSSVAPSTAYTYQVATKDLLGNESARTAPASITTPAAADRTVPSKPSALTASVLSSVAVELSWKASSDNTGVASYVIYRDGQAVASSSAATQYVDGSLTAGTTYTYRVVAFDAAGNTASSDTVTVTTLSGSSRRRSVR